MYYWIDLVQGTASEGFSTQKEAMDDAARNTAESGDCWGGNLEYGEFVIVKKVAEVNVIPETRYKVEVIETEGAEVTRKTGFTIFKIDKVF